MITIKKTYLNAEACSHLGFPTPYEMEKQIDYVLRLLKCGYTINTHQARYIGIHNLHSIASTLYKKKYQFEKEHKSAIDPRTNEWSPRAVDHLYMTPEQRALIENALKDYDPESV